VGDVVDTPDSAIKSWRYLGAGEWEPNDAVRYTTSPGGGSAFLTAGAQQLLRKQSLLEMYPLPRMRNLLDPSSVDIANAIKPAAATISVVDAPGEYGGQAIRIDLPAGLTTATGRITLPLRPGFDGSYPKCTPRIEWRMRVEDFAKTPQLFVWLSDNKLSTHAGYYWVLCTAGTSQFGSLAPYPGKWNGAYRTYVTSPYLQRSQSGAVPAWDGTSEMEVQSIRLTVETNDATTIYLNRVSCPIWSRGAMITQLDGGYALSYEPVFREFQRRGWPGVASFLGDAEGESIGYEARREMVDAGWDVCQHVAALTDAVQPVSSTMTAGTTAANVRRAIQGWRQLAESNGYFSAGAQTYSQLTNAGPAGIADAAAIYREAGVLGGRGRLSDAEFGVDPYNAATNSFSMSDPWPGGWSPRWGRYNRYYLDAVQGQSTPALRDMYAGSALETLVNRVAAGANLGWVYIHRVQPLTESTPTSGNSGPALVRDYVARLDELALAGSVLSISATEADYLTYDRPGDVHLRWDGVWVSRTTGKVVL
jgi:hypothetical protein